MRRILVHILFLAGLIALWLIVIRVGHVPSYMLPTPMQVGRALFLKWDNLSHAFAITATEALGGFFLSVVFGWALGFTFSAFAPVRHLFYPYTLLLQTVPIVAVAPLILMWLGSGLPAVMLVAAILCIFPIIANTTQGLVAADRNLIQLFRMADASKFDMLFKLRVPYALPQIFTGLRIASGLASIGAVTGELFASSNVVGEGGLGYSIIYASSQLQTDYLFGLVLVSSALGFMFYFAVVYAEWLCLRKWHDSVLRND